MSSFHWSLHVGKAGYGSGKRKLSADRNILFRRNRRTLPLMYSLLTKNNGRVTADSSVPNSPKRLSWDFTKCTACSAAMVIHSLQCDCNSGVNSRGQILKKKGSFWQTEIEARHVDILPTLIPPRRTICTVPIVVRSLYETDLLCLILVKWSLQKITWSPLCSTHSNNTISIHWASRWIPADSGGCPYTYE